ncbi:metallophosphoesterase [Natrarchaeobius halalkaliphilus]|uniref:Metallophosphoesterase n=1 Tax=Natrarchaeobius halalkaliphilus TaxID=1679091 RepID=A0A3N6P5Y3_9EURY|nr:metallophosphoesterase [Natrarchaeobius halalkaliphilus]RQG91095.1 metallophosphoesterase [Natrarchaeobius halalkaliphilus]
MSDLPSSVHVEPVPGEPAATALVSNERILLIADYHAGYEAGLRYERGVDVPSHASDRRERLLALLQRTNPDRLVVLGDLMHSIGDPGGAERGELEILFESFPAALDVTVVKGNHDGVIETWLGGTGVDEIDDDDRGIETGESSGTDARAFSRTAIVPGSGVAFDGLGVCHGHSWPAPAALESDVLCLGHEHPCVRLEDELGGSRTERAWLRGRIDPTPFRDRPEYEGVSWLETGATPEVVVVPAFNDLVGGTWVNVSGRSFLSPFLPDGLDDGEAYLLDGTRLGSYRRI